MNINLLNKPSILVMDLDLTLHNVISSYDESVNETIKHFGYEYLSKEELDSLSDNFIDSRDMLAQHISHDKLDEAVEYHFNHFLSREIPPNALLPGANQLLESVKNDFNLPILGITNTNQLMAEKILRDLKVFDKFNFVIGIKEGNLPKPDPQMLLLALNQVSSIPGPHVWFVGDRISDTQCAKESNCTAIRFYHKIKPEDKYADLFVNSHYQLFDLISSKIK
jgi:phosphoglycolate phosphatase